MATRPVAGLAVRAMTAEDLPEVMRIERASFSSPWTLATFAGLLGREGTRLWVAETGGEVAGYAVVWMVADQAELGDVAVAEPWRRRGIGTRLVETVLDTMAELGIRELFLEVRVSNRGARDLYARHGFLEVGVRKGYYTRPREDALIFQRRIPPTAL